MEERSDIIQLRMTIKDEAVPQNEIVWSTRQPGDLRLVKIEDDEIFTQSKDPTIPDQFQTSFIYDVDVPNLTAIASWRCYLPPLPKANQEPLINIIMSLKITGGVQSFQDLGVVAADCFQQVYVSGQKVDIDKKALNLIVCITAKALPKPQLYMDFNVRWDLLQPLRTKVDVQSVFNILQRYIPILPNLRVLESASSDDTQSTLSDFSELELGDGNDVLEDTPQPSL